MMTTSTIAWLATHAAPWLLVLARVLGLSATAPAWGTPGLGVRFRLAMALLLTALLVPLLGAELAAPVGPTAIFRACLAEAATGAAFGWGAALIVAAARQAGEIVGAQAGLSAAALLDPEAGEEMTPLGHLYGWIALGVFLAIDGPLRLVGVLVDSYKVVPAGGLALTPEAATQVFGRLARALELSLRAAAPAATALILAGLALGLIARAAPAFPFWSLSLPVRSAVGVLLVLLTTAALVGLLANAWEISLSGPFGA